MIANIVVITSKQCKQQPFSLQTAYKSNAFLVQKSKKQYFCPVFFRLFKQCQRVHNKYFSLSVSCC